MQGYSCAKELDSGALILEPRCHSLQHDWKKLLCLMFGLSQDWLPSNFMIDQNETPFYNSLPIQPALQHKNKFDVQLFRHFDSVPVFVGLASKQRTTPKGSNLKPVDLPFWGILWPFHIE